MTDKPHEHPGTEHPPPHVEVVIEIPRGSFLKRGSGGELDFISPFPCPFNYGSVHEYVGGDGEFLDAVVLGPRLATGTRIKVTAWGAVGLFERFMYDDKLICASSPLSLWQRRRVVIFFKLYARCKNLLNLLRGRRGSCRYAGWDDAHAAIQRASSLSRH